MFTSQSATIVNKRRESLRQRTTSLLSSVTTIVPNQFLFSIHMWHCLLLKWTKLQSDVKFMRQLLYFTPLSPSPSPHENEGRRNIEDGEEWQRVLRPLRSVTIDSEVNDGTWSNDYVFMYNVAGNWALQALKKRFCFYLVTTNDSTVSKTQTLQHNAQLPQYWLCHT
jgi:hypothetical protein